MSEAQVARGVGRKAWPASALRESLPDFGPHDQRKRAGKVASRLGEKQRTALGTQRASLMEIGCKKLAGHVAVAHHPFRSILRMLSPNADLTIRKVEISHLKPHQFLAAQRSIVGEQQHDLVAQLFSLEHAQHVLPLLV